ncbi:hypothetical protein LCGC14_2073370, partial [marine sediment metagenome]
MPFAGFVNFQDCVRQNPDKNDPDAYCGSIQARTENKLAKAVTAASHLNQAVRNALKAVVAKAHDPNRERVFPTEECPDGQHNHEKGMRCHDKGQEHREFSKAHDPVKEEGDKKLKESDGVAADGAQDDQAFAVAFGPDNYDQLTKRIMAAPYKDAYQAAGTIVKALEKKQMNFPGNLEDHLKKAHAAVHGREMWDERYSDVCDLLKKARKLLHGIEREAEAAEGQQQGQEIKQVVGKADPVSKPRGPRPGETVGPTGWQTSTQRVSGGKRVGKPKARTYRPGERMGKANPVDKA